MINIQSWIKNKLGGRCFICHKTFGVFEQKFVESSENILKDENPELVKKINKYGKMVWGDRVICEKCAVEFVKKKKLKEKKRKEEYAKKLKEKKGEKNEEIDVSIGSNDVVQPNNG